MHAATDHLLQIGQTIRTEPSGLTCEVQERLGAGSQGEVYRASLGGYSVALKWYFPTAATAEQRTNLETIVKRGTPNQSFLWPMDLAFAKGLPGFGYVMPLREPRYRSIVDLVTRRSEPTFRALTTAALQLADCYLQLHSLGLCYRDISFGNVFFDPRNGDVLICDNDNVTVNGSTRKGVLGTPRFMAPEVVRWEALPSIQTDLYSLATLLFYMLMVHHPLEGKQERAIRCLDLPAMTKLYGTHALFIFDPKDTSNRPVPGEQDNVLAFWPTYPRFIRDLFTTAFTDGIRDPQNGRIRESQWRAAMIRLRDLIIYCQVCSAENFYDAMTSKGGARGVCWSCRKALQFPPRIRIGKDVLVALNHDTKLYPHHTNGARMYDFSEPIAAVARHPTRPDIWGLKNLSGDRWTCSTADGASAEVAPGLSVTLAPGTKIQFGKTEGEIRM